MAYATSARLLASRECLSLRILGPIAAVATAALAGVTAVEAIAPDPGTSILLALAFWLPMLAMAWGLGRVLAWAHRGEPSAAAVAACLAFACLAGAVPLGVGCLASMSPARAVAWAVTVALESYAVVIAGVAVLRQRTLHRREMSGLAERMAAVQRERTALAGAREAMAQLADAAFAEALETANRAHVMLSDSTPSDEIGRLLDDELRANARAAGHLINDLAVHAPERPAGSRFWWQALAVRPPLLASFSLACVLGLPLVALRGTLPGSLVRQFAAMAIAWGVAEIVHGALRRRMPGAATLSALAAGSLAGSLAVAWGWAQSAWGVVALGLLLTPTCLVVTMLPIAWQAMNLRAANERDAAEADYAQAQEMLADERGKFEDERTRLTSALHTTVQGRATAAIVALELGEPGRAADMLELLGHPVPVIPTDALATVLREWSSSLAIASQVDPLLTDAERDRVARHVGEALLNAVRHGKATSVEVAVSRQGAWLVLEVDDDGSGPVEALIEGLGAELARRESGTWHLEGRRPRGARLRVELPPA